MPAVVATTVFDAALNYIKTNSTKLVLCSAEPTTFTQANTTFKLAEVTLAGAGADLTIAAGDGPTGARKVTLAAKTVTGTATGLATHFALISGSELIHRNTMTNVGITNAVTQDVNAVRVLEILQPV
jgi:hypothetical protein